MKEKMNKLIHYTWHYFWNVMVVYLVLVPIYAVLLFCIELWKTLCYIFHEIKDASKGQHRVNEKKMLALQQKFKGKV